MPNVRLFVSLTAALLLALACDSEIREINVSQEKYIDDYINGQLADYEVFRNEGVSRVVVEAGMQGGPVLERGDSVYLFYAGYIFGQSGLGSRFVLDSGMVRVGRGDLIDGLDKGLPGARQGEEALLLFTSEHGYGAQAVGLVPENSALLFDVRVGTIKKKQ